jgi:hypothetical protein
MHVAKSGGVPRRRLHVRKRFLGLHAATDQRMQQLSDRGFAFTGLRLYLQRSCYGMPLRL